MRKLYQELAGLMLARENCVASGNKEWFGKHTYRLKVLVHEHMPSGSGFNNGTTLVVQDSTSEKLVFQTAFHHMDDNGSYAGWSEHTVIVKPSLFDGFSLRITGRDRRDIKDYIHETFAYSLGLDVKS